MNTTIYILVSNTILDQKTLYSHCYLCFNFLYSLTDRIDDQNIDDDIIKSHSMNRQQNLLL